MKLTFSKPIISLKIPLMDKNLGYDRADFFELLREHKHKCFTEKDRKAKDRERESMVLGSRVHRGAIDLFLIAVLAGERGQSVVVADGARKVVH